MPKELVLLGGGHAHVEVLRQWGKRPVPDVRLTLITRDLHTPYSGMLPGYVSGFYSYQDCHIDLGRLSRYAHATLVQQAATGIDTKAREVVLTDGARQPYDLLSVNIGITPAASTIPGAAQYTTPVKPIDRFVARFADLLARLAASTEPLTLAVVGGGAGGVELALALAYRMRQERSRPGAPQLDQPDTIELFSGGRILPGHSDAVAAALRAQAAVQGVVLHEHSPVLEVQEGRLQTADGGWHAFDEALWCTQAAAAAWLRDTGLPVDASGFLLINEFLQSAGGPPEVFAVGDVATSVTHPRPKAGVYAVRQGPPLFMNLCRSLTNQPLQPYIPQQQALALISAGDRYAIGSRGWLTFQGRWAWSLKDYIDRSFMNKYGKDLHINPP